MPAPSYTPTTWVNNTAPAISADNLNHIEGGIAANAAAFSGYAPKFGTGLTPSGDTSGTTDLANLNAAIAAQMGSGGTIYLTPGDYYVNAPVVIKPGNSGTTNVPAKIPSLITFGGAGRIGDEADVASAVRIIAAPTFPVGSFLLDIQQNGTPYSGAGGTFKGFTLECNNLAAGLRGQGLRECRFEQLTIVDAAAPVSPGDGANGAFSMTDISNGGSAVAYNVIQQVTVTGWFGDGFFESTNGQNTYIGCRSFTGAGTGSGQPSEYGGASYHLALTTVTGAGVPNHVFLDCVYGGGLYGVIVDSPSAPLFYGLELFTGVPWPSKNALLLNGWQYNLDYFYPPAFTNCRFINDPASGTTEADGAAVRMAALQGAYRVDATFTGCMFGQGTSNRQTRFVYSDAGLVAGGVVTFRDCYGNGAPTLGAVNDQSKIARFYNCKGINPLAVASPAVPASGTAQTNTSGTDCTVYVTGGTVSAVAVNGVATGLTAGAFRVPAGATITLTYTAAPTWVWVGD